MHGQLIALANLRGHSGVVWSISWSSRGILASCGADRTVKVWHSGESSKIGDTWTCVATFGGQTFLRSVRDIAWASDGRSIAVASFDATAFVLELMGGKDPHLEAAVSLEGHDSEVKSVCYSSSGGLLATCSRDKSVWIWEVGLDFEYDCIAVLNGHSADVKSVVWHPSVEMLLSCSYDGTVRIWVEDADDWFCSETLSAHSSTVWSAAFDKEGTGLVTASGDGSLVVWRREDPPSSVIGAHPHFKVVARTQYLHDGPIYSVDWNKGNRLIATGGGDDAVRIMRLKSQTADRNDVDVPEKSAPGSDQSGTGRQGTMEQSDTGDDIVHSALVDNCEVVCVEPRAHTGDVNRVAWHPTDFGVLASCGDDGLVRIWRYADRFSTASSG